MFNVRLLGRVGFLRATSRRVQFNGAASGRAVVALLFTMSLFAMSLFAMSLFAMSLFAMSLFAMSLFAMSLVGCGSGNPFELAPVEGKITYADGSLIKADQILVQLVPQGIKAQGKVAPRAAQTYADVSDGSFSDLTTWKYGDGVMVGKHKVVVISLRNDALGVGEPTRAIPQRYHRRKTTPLEVEVSASGDNNFTFEIEKEGT